MMSEHLSQSQLAGYSGRTLDPDELLAVDGHLASCDVCHKRLTGILPGVAKLASAHRSSLVKGHFISITINTWSHTLMARRTISIARLSIVTLPYVPNVLTS